MTRKEEINRNIRISITNNKREMLVRDQKGKTFEILCKSDSYYEGRA